jgi:hypothetical protein
MTETEDLRNKILKNEKRLEYFCYVCFGITFWIMFWIMFWVMFWIMFELFGTVEVPDAREEGDFKDSPLTRDYWYLLDG